MTSARGVRTRAVAAALLRDPIVIALLVVWALGALPYALPLDQAWLAQYQALVLFPPLIAMAVIACVHGLKRLESWQERQFWTLVGAGFTAWLVSYLPYYFLPAGARGLRFELTGELLYLLFYICLLLALDVRPHLATSSRVGDVERWIKSLGAVLLTFAALVYFVLIPAAFNPSDYGTWVPSLSMYVALDVFVVIRVVALAAHASPGRWRLLYSALGLATTLMLVVDVFEYLGWAGALRVVDGHPVDLFWTVPLVAYALAVRLRHHAGAAPAAVPFLEAFETSPLRTGSFLLTCALSAPAIHLLLYLAGLLDPTTKTIREWVVLATLVVLGGLAAVAYRSVERERVAMRRRQQQLEAQLRQAERVQTLAKMAESLTHDFSNLLQVIGGRCEPLLAELPRESPLREDIEAIRAAARRITALVVQLMELLRTEFDAPQVVRLSDIVRGAEHFIRRLASDQVRLETRVRAARDVVRVDPRQIERVLYSLAANAREAMPDGGTLVVETFDIDLSVRGGGELGLVPGPYAALSVVDSGSGMSEETLARAFQPFYTTRRGAERTGLGLTNAMLVVSHYGGTIRIDSQLGKGTTVAVYLPRAEAKVVDTAPAGSVEGTLRLRSFVSRLAGRMS